MNTRQAIDESVGAFSLSSAFNNENSCFSIGLDTGFCGRLSYLQFLEDVIQIGADYICLIDSVQRRSM